MIRHEKDPDRLAAAVLQFFLSHSSLLLQDRAGNEFSLRRRPTEADVPLPPEFAALLRHLSERIIQSDRSQRSVRKLLRLLGAYAVWLNLTAVQWREAACGGPPVLDVVRLIAEHVMRLQMTENRRHRNLLRVQAAIDEGDAEAAGRGLCRLYGLATGPLRRLASVFTFGLLA